MVNSIFLLAQLLAYVLKWLRFESCDFRHSRCQSKFDCFIYDMLFIKELKPALNKQFDPQRKE